MFVAKSLDKVPAWQVGAKPAIPRLKSDHGRLTNKPEVENGVPAREALLVALSFTSPRLRRPSHSLAAQSQRNSPPVAVW